MHHTVSIIISAVIFLSTPYDVGEIGSLVSVDDIFLGNWLPYAALGGDALGTLAEILYGYCADASFWDSFHG